MEDDKRKEAVEAQQEHAVRTGRKRDHSRDDAILDATIEILAEVGYVGMTVEMVAQRAKAGKATVYRRWRSKAALVTAAIARIRDHSASTDSLPDTGSLRDDLLTLFAPGTPAAQRHRLHIMMGITSFLVYNETPDPVGNDAIVEPWARACRTLIRRSAERGEIHTGGLDVETLSRFIPSMAVCRAVLERQPADQAFLTRLIDGVFMPNLLASAR